MFRFIKDQPPYLNCNDLHSDISSTYHVGNTQDTSIFYQKFPSEPFMSLFLQSAIRNICSYFDTENAKAPHQNSIARHEKKVDYKLRKISTIKNVAFNFKINMIRNFFLLTGIGKFHRPQLNAKTKRSVISERQTVNFSFRNRSIQYWRTMINL